MRIAVSTDQGYVSAHFGRCASYTILEISEGKILSREEIPNPGHQPGFLPQFLSDKGVNCIIAGGMGPRAQALFAQKNIETITGVQGPIDVVIDKLLKQELKAGEDLCDHGHGEAGHDVHEYRHDSPLHPIQSAPRLSDRKICVTSVGPDLDSEVDLQFGRAHFFLIFDPQTEAFAAIENPNRELAQGAGIQTAQWMVNQNIGVVLTGTFGPKAARVLEAAGIQLRTGFSGRVKDALAEFKSEV